MNLDINSKNTFNLVPWRKPLFLAQLRHDLLMMIFLCGLFSVLFESILLTIQLENTLLTQKEQKISQAINSEKKLWMDTRILKNQLAESEKILVEQNKIEQAWLNLYQFLFFIRQLQSPHFHLQKIHCQNNQCELDGQVSEQHFLENAQNNLDVKGYSTQLVDWQPTADKYFNFKLQLMHTPL